MDNNMTTNTFFMIIKINKKVQVLYRLFNFCVGIYNESKKQKVTKKKRIRNCKEKKVNLLDHLYFGHKKRP